MYLAWATDIHLNYASEPRQRKFYYAVKEQADALVVTGDIAESHDIQPTLTAMATLIERPVHFVLGNHDFYRGSIADTRRDVAETAKGIEHLVCLNRAGIVELTQRTALVGRDGWRSSFARQ